MASSTEKQKAIVLHEKDHVATALEDLNALEVIEIQHMNQPVILKQEIKFGHKFAVQAVKAGEPVMKYGVPIGLAIQSIQIGEYVHLHNLMSMQMKGDCHEGLSESGWKNRNT